MKLAVPVWQDRVSPVFDVAGTLLLVDAEDGCETARREIELTEIDAHRRAERLRCLDVEILICGSLSRAMLEMLAHEGVTVLPWVAGSADEVVRAFLDGRLDAHRFRMPGCRCTWGPGRHRHGGRGRCRPHPAAGTIPPPHSDRTVDPERFSPSKRRRP